MYSSHTVPNISGKIGTLMELSYICFKDCFANFQLFHDYSGWKWIFGGGCTGYAVEVTKLRLTQPSLVELGFAKISVMIRRAISKVLDILKID